MKKFLLSMFTPVLALLPSLAHADDETCQVGRQVFEFVPTGETLAFRDLSSAEDPPERMSSTGYLKLPDIAGESEAADPYIKMDGLDGETRAARGYLKIGDIDGESRAATGYIKIGDIAGESQRGEVYPKVEGVRAAETVPSTALDKSTTKLVEAVANGTLFVEWHADMLADVNAVRPPLVEMASGSAFIKIGDIEGESLSAKYIDKSSPILAVKASCEE